MTSIQSDYWLSLVPTLRVGMPPGRSASLNGRGTFPRGAWERDGKECLRSAFPRGAWERDQVRNSYFKKT